MAAKVVAGANSGHPDPNGLHQELRLVLSSTPVVSATHLLAEMAKTTSDAATEVALAVSATRWVAETTGVELRTSRSSWWSLLGSGWPELAPAMTLAATGVQVKANPGLGCAVRCGKCTVGLNATW